MDYQAFLRELETHALPAADFDHRAHLLAAWAYRSRYPAREAAARCARTLSRYAMAHGAAEKYHHTLTMALLAIMYSRLDAQPGQQASWDDFLAANADLMADSRAIVARHYSEQRLQHHDARRAFVAPDLAPLPMSCLLH